MMLTPAGIPAGSIFQPETRPRVAIDLPSLIMAKLAPCTTRESKYAFVERMAGKEQEIIFSASRTEIYLKRVII